MKHHYKECGGSGILAHGLSARSVARSLVAGTGSWPCLVHGGWFNRLQCDGDCDGAHVMLSASIKHPSQRQSQLKCVTKQRAPPPPPPPPVPNHKHAPTHPPHRRAGRAQGASPPSSFLPGENSCTRGAVPVLCSTRPLRAPVLGPLGCTHPVACSFILSARTDPKTGLVPAHTHPIPKKI